MAEHDKVYWHPAFFETLQLEFDRYSESLNFINEFQLSKEALRIDVLITNKNPGQHIDKNIGRIFKTYNVFEFKSETDSLLVQDYNKVIGYAFLYSSFTNVSVSDITVSFSITKHPRELLKYLSDERGFKIEKQEKGIYYVRGDAFPVQIIEGKLLSSKENLFLRNLSSKLSVPDVKETIEAYKKIKPSNEKGMYLDRLIQANRNAFKEAMSVSEAVKELFFEVAEEDGWLEQDRTENAKKMAKKLLFLGVSAEKIAEASGLPIELVASLA